MLDVKINANPTPTPSIPHNPDVTFQVGDYVWVQYVNRNPSNLFIPYKRHLSEGISGGDTIIDQLPIFN